MRSRQLLLPHRLLLQLFRLLLLVVTPEIPTPTPTSSPIATSAPLPTLDPKSTATPISFTFAPTPTETLGPAADVIFFNGHVVTIEPDLPVAEALAVLGEDILALGTSDEVLKFQGADTRVIDLGGRTPLPGFVDPHTHPLDTASIDESQQYFLEGGTTTFGDTSVSPEKLERLLEALESTDLRVRTTLYLNYNHKCNGLEPEGWLLEYPPDLGPTQMLRKAGIKIFGDPAGSIAPCGAAAVSFPLPAALVEERQSGLYGDLLLSSEDMARVISEHQALGYQAVIHARGDMTIETALNAIESALAGQPNTFRHRIEHNDYIRPELLSRYSEVGAIPTIRGRPTACGVNDLGGVHPFGDEVQTWFRIGRSLLDANPGLPVAWHSDVVPYSRRPIHDLYDWVTRKRSARTTAPSACLRTGWLPRPSASKRPSAS